MRKTHSSCAAHLVHLVGAVHVAVAIQLGVQQLAVYHLHLQCSGGARRGHSILRMRPLALSAGCCCAAVVRLYMPPFRAHKEWHRVEEGTGVSVVNCDGVAAM